MNFYLFNGNMFAFLNFAIQLLCSAKINFHGFRILISYLQEHLKGENLDYTNNLQGAPRLILMNAP